VSEKALGKPTALADFSGASGAEMRELPRRKTHEALEAAQDETSPFRTVSTPHDT